MAEIHYYFGIRKTNTMMFWKYVNKVFLKLCTKFQHDIIKN